MRTLVTSLYIPRYDDIGRMLGGVLRALLAGDWRVTGSIVKIARYIWEVGAAGWPVTGRRRGAFSTLLQ